MRFKILVLSNIVKKIKNRKIVVFNKNNNNHLNLILMFKISNKNFINNNKNIITINKNYYNINYNNINNSNSKLKNNNKLILNNYNKNINSHQFNKHKIYLMKMF
jgi:hypothetical protein